VTKKLHLRPYKIRQVKVIEESDYERRSYFCNRFLQEVHGYVLDQELTFFGSVLEADKGNLHVFWGTGSIEGCYKRRIRSTLFYVGFFAIIITNMYNCILLTSNDNTVTFE
jgi:hypothetical protein